MTTPFYTALISCWAKATAFAIVAIVLVFPSELVAGTVGLAVVFPEVEMTLGMVTDPQEVAGGEAVAWALLLP